MKKNIKNIQLTKILLASLVISVSLVLFQINSVYLDKKFKMPIIYSNYWNFWHLPLIFLCLFFSLKDTLFFLFVYMILDISLYSWPKYAMSIPYMLDKSGGATKTTAFLVFYGNFIPVLAYIFIAIFMDLRKNNFKKIIMCFILIVLVQSISRGLSGYLYWYNDIIKTLQKNNYTKLLNWLQDTPKMQFMTIWVLNLIPVLTSNITNFIVFFIIKKRVIKTYDLYSENYSFKQNISKS
ncbi:hypothetical protein CWO85_00495 [Candidatus Phytoplasma ziziphi]|uniref:Uncharacterized protein n=1 Tax=Ziziphus jujuba witches'-broom phytoplasma TaxID=135727 RepID=A0A660HLU4_ZIZJU|nr:hypothetical protein [Candidatus Phytoplasma ziziphi]AYJ01021.1 hypothetical protein CWO85_00495 [Candidatus Phytoplasma ziziphi]